MAEILARSGLPALLPRPLPDDRLQASIHRLGNGMTVYISTDHSRPRFVAWIAVRAGSRHDPPTSTGLAHYLEHMLFKGTDKLGTLDYEAEQRHLKRIEKLYNNLRSGSDSKGRQKILTEIDAETQKSSRYVIPNELDTLYARLGVKGLNAFTSNEETVYIADVPSNRLQAWAEVEAERFGSAVFRLFYPELETVYEEKNRSLDNPDRRAAEALNLALYPRHPYGTQPTLGQIRHLKTPAFADMVAFFHQSYVPNNMAIVLAGDVTPEAVLPVLERTLGHLRPRPLPEPARGEIAPVRGRQVHVVQAEGKTQVALAWPTVGLGHADRPALEVMDWLVDNSRSGLLNVELILKQRLPAAGSYPNFHLEAGHWVLHGTARQGQSTEEVEQLLLSVVRKLKAGQFTQQDLDAIVLHQEMREQRALEHNQARAQKMTSSFVERRPWAETASWSARLKKVTREEVIRVATRYLDKKSYVVVQRVKGEYEPPKIPKPRITPIRIDASRQSAFAQKVLARRARPIKPRWVVQGEHYDRQKLPAGGLIAVKNPVNELFAVNYRFDLGSRRQRLLCYALDLLEISGAGDLPADKLQKQLYALGTTIKTRCGAEQSTLSVEGIDRNLEPSIQILDRWLRDPAFDETTLAKLLTNTLSLREDHKREPRYVESALHSFSQLERNSPFLLVPSNKALRRARSQVLRLLLGQLPDRQHRTTYFGPRSADEAARVVALGRRHRRVLPRVPLRYRQVRGPRLFFLDKRSAQAKVALILRQPPLPRDRRAVSTMYQEYLGGGMGALLFQEIREARGLAYTVWGIYHIGRRLGDEAAVLAGLGTQADKAYEALLKLTGLIRDLPLDQTRFDRAKKALDEEYCTDWPVPRQVPGWVQFWDDMGEPGDPRPERLEQIRALKPDDLAAFARGAAARPPVISVMADRSRIDLTALGKVAPVQEVKVEQIFSF